MRPLGGVPRYLLYRPPVLLLNHPPPSNQPLLSTFWVAPLTTHHPLSTPIGLLNHLLTFPTLLNLLSTPSPLPLPLMGWRQSPGVKECSPTPLPLPHWPTPSGDRWRNQSERTGPWRHLAVNVGTNHSGANDEHGLLWEDGRWRHLAVASRTNHSQRHLADDDGELFAGNIGFFFLSCFKGFYDYFLHVETNRKRRV